MTEFSNGRMPSFTAGKLKGASGGRNLEPEIRLAYEAMAQKCRQMAKQA